MTPLDRQLLLWINGLAGSSAALFEGALLLCGPVPLVACVATLLRPARATSLIAAGVRSPSCATSWQTIWI